MLFVLLLFLVDVLDQAGQREMVELEVVVDVMQLLFDVLRVWLERPLKLYSNCWMPDSI